MGSFCRMRSGSGASLRSGSRLWLRACLLGCGAGFLRLRARLFRGALLLGLRALLLLLALHLLLLDSLLLLLLLHSLLLLVLLSALLFLDVALL